MHARYGVACSALGSAIACYNAAKGFAGKREVFGKAIAAYQLVQERQMLRPHGDALFPNL